MRAATKQLGYVDTYHMMSCTCPTLCCGWTHCAFVEELIEAYPEAKVVMTGRDVASWHASTTRTVYWRATDPELRAPSRFSWAARIYYPMLPKFFDTFFEGDFPGRGKAVYTRHCDDIRKLVPEHRLLEYRVTDGWVPLCKSLGNHVPMDCPFPNVNDNRDFVT
ncbi:hypothetical protein F4818DRAFT_437824 [Hypoxylon cercidicola]|nr:hypothetical protein F4818DRAFT_437824 [Hypoxylon cercidicola]